MTECRRGGCGWSHVVVGEKKMPDIIDIVIGRGMRYLQENEHDCMKGPRED